MLLCFSGHCATSCSVPTTPCKLQPWSLTHFYVVDRCHFHDSKHCFELIPAQVAVEYDATCFACRCEVKVIDLGSSCFTSDHLSSYVQSRSYRAPEVILGLPYDQKIDIWSFGCILAELLTGTVLFQVCYLTSLAWKSAS